jgi:hypothetical protein
VGHTCSVCADAEFRIFLSDYKEVFQNVTFSEMNRILEKTAERGTISFSQFA